MKYDNFAAFEKHVENSAPAHFADVYLLVSKEPYDRAALEQVLIQKIQKSRKNVQTKSFSAESVEMGPFLLDLNAFSFFAEHQIFLLRNGEKLKGEDRDLLAEYFDSPHRKATLAISAETIATNTKFYKKLEKVGVVVDLPKLAPFAEKQFVSEWARNYFQVAGKEISPQVLDGLLQQLGTDRNYLEQELEKLILYTGDQKTIENKDIEAICVKTNQETIWKLGDAIFARNAALSMQILRALLLEGVEGIPLLRQIRNQIQRGFQIYSILREGGTSSQITEIFPYMKGSILKKNIDSATQFGMERFKKALLLIDEGELESRNGNIPFDILAEKLILQVIL